MSAHIHTCSYQCDRPACIKVQRDELAKLNEQLQERVAELEKDAELLDFLADLDQNIANVTLPIAIVQRNLHSLRDAIREAKSQWDAKRGERE